MSAHTNPGNFANRPREDVVAAGIAGGHREGAGSAVKHQKEAHNKLVAEGLNPLAPTGNHGDNSAQAAAPAGEEQVAVEEYEDEGEYEQEEGGDGGSDDKPKRGFAAMPKEKVIEIARKGGHASHGGH